VHPLSKKTGANAAKRPAITPSWRGAGFGDFPKEEVARSREGISGKEIKKESPECRTKTLVQQ
jgi:hypothetical protein